VKFTKKTVIPAGIIATLLLTAGACDTSSPSASQKESSSRDHSYSALVNRQPAHHMDYSPTRETINSWIDVWNDPNAVSYVYLQGADGKLLGYYVLKGRPVTMCAALTPPDQVEHHSGTDNGGNVDRPAPGTDGVYYSGGQCNDYYGFTTDGVYVEFTLGNGQNELLYTQPLPQANNVPNLAPAAK
jgi:hypothetical protein